MPPQDLETSDWFEREVKPHESMLKGYLHRWAVVSDIDDLVQETYLRVIRARAEGRVQSTRGLLFATARNAALDLFRRRATAKTSSMTEIDCSRVLDEKRDTSEAISRQQEIDLLREAIQDLPDRCRAILLLRKFENLSHKEIAERLGIKVHTVEAQLTKALHRCESYFARKGALPPIES